MHLLFCLTALLCASLCRGLCNVQVRGVTDSWKEAIVKKHNELRAKVANGEEGNLPKAANMLEMVWDDLLSQKAQEWAEKCKFSHDTQKDRDTGQGRTGQNIAYRRNAFTDPDWKGVIQDFYNEVADFNSSDIDKYSFQYNVSHFTEIIWAKTYKVGCGYVRYLENKSNKHLYGCNYLPGGNILTTPIYETGDSCSSCGGCGLTPGLCDPTLLNLTTLKEDDSLFQMEPENLGTGKGIKSTKTTVKSNAFTITFQDFKAFKTFKTFPEYFMKNKKTTKG